MAAPGAARLKDHALSYGTQHLQARGISALGFQLEEVLEGKEKSKRQCAGDGADGGVGILI